MMLRVLIVDDEYLLCEHIRRSIDWAALEMEVVGMGRDGIEALRLIEEEHPDIVMADINMPNMDGLQLASRIQLEYPEVRVILVTGYGEFEYAQQAMRFGVERYLLKPINAELYAQELRAVKDEILNRKAEKRVLEILKAGAQGEVQSFPAFDGIRNGVENGDDEGILSGKTGPWCLVMLRWNREDGEYLDRQAEYPVAGWGTRFDDALDGYPHVVYSHDGDSYIAAIAVREQAELLDRLKAWVEAVKEKSGCCVYLGVSDVCCEYERLHEMYLQAQRALASTYTQTDKCVVSFSDAGEEIVGSLTEFFDFERLLMDLRLNNQEGVYAAIEGMFRRMSEYGASKENAVFISLMIFDTLQRFMRETNTEISGMGFMSISVEMNKRKSIKELETYVLMLFEKALESIFYQSQTGKSERAQKVCQFIRENYADKELSLNMVARAMYLNASYLSSLFRKETGITLVEYINRVRLKAAKELIDKSPKITVYELASRVGYNNEYYFMRCFKKQFGLSPKTYMCLKRQEDEL